MPQRVREDLMDRSREAFGDPAREGERATQGLSVREVVASMGMGARLAEMRFRTMTGRLIQEEIMLTRFKQVFQMLRRGPISHAALADVCGFRSVCGYGIITVIRQRKGY